ncbi:MAG: site-2 protease family protein [Clostridia bacterium]|nr:site-2 protease family protein [Clostridia bacterium]
MRGHISINPLLILTLILAWQMKYLSIFLVTYGCLVFHEGIHLWFLCKYRIPVRKITLEPFGISIRTGKKTPENAVIYLSAPIGNFLVAGCLVMSHSCFHIPLYSQWILANLSLGLVNLLPILPLDGGRALLLFLEKRMGKERAKKRMNLLGILVSVPLIIGFIALTVKEGGSFGFIIIFIFLCYNLLSGNRPWEYKKLYQTAFRSEKRNFRDTILVEHLGVHWDYPAKKLLKKFRGEKYYVINVFRDGVLLKTLTETQILNRILACEQNITVSEC